MVLATKKKKKTTGKKTSEHAKTRAEKITWDGVGTTSSSGCSSTTIFGILALCLLILMVDLYFFVDGPEPVSSPRQEQQEKPKQNFTRPPKKPTFMATEEVNMIQLQQFITDLEDSILVVAFEEANAEGSRKQLWKRWERIARAIPKKGQFKRADEEDLPKIVRFDCTYEQQAACEQLVGSNNLPAVVMWKSRIPRFIPEEIRTDTQIFNYLAKQMQEAVTYCESGEEVDYFITEEGINLFYFGKDESGAYRSIADILRDVANFGRTQDSSIAERFEAEMPSLRLYRQFDESPLTFAGNLSDSQAIGNFVRENSVPLFGEWTAQTVKMYTNRKLPVVFIAVDPTEDESEVVLAKAKELASEYWGTFSFTHLDAIMNADLAKRLGTSELPEVLILSGTEIRRKIDLDAPISSIRSALQEWHDASTRGPETTTDLDDDYDYEDEYDEAEDYEETDLDEEEEDDDEQLEEEEKEEL